VSFFLSFKEARNYFAVHTCHPLKPGEQILSLDSCSYLPYSGHVCPVLLIQAAQTNTAGIAINAAETKPEHLLDFFQKNSIFTDIVIFGVYFENTQSPFFVLISSKAVQFLLDRQRQSISSIYPVIDQPLSDRSWWKCPLCKLGHC
jgi:hypothetical protein